MKIDRITNGYILSWDEEVKEGVFETQKEVIEDRDTDKETMSALFEWIAEHFGIGYDKWGKENLRISWDKEGHKVC